MDLNKVMKRRGTMKNLLVVLLLLLGGCSQIRQSEPKASESKKVHFQFEGKKLLISNDSEKILTVSESETVFSVEEKKKWVSIDKTKSSLAMTSNVLSNSVYDYDLTQPLSEIGSNKVKITVFYTFGDADKDVQYEQEIIYEE
ncbi:hypothetical protein IGJ55_001054 [Enterococcus sp. AZ170]